MDRHRFEDDHRGAADRALGVIGDMALGRQSIDGHVCCMSAKYDAVAKGVPMDQERTEQAGKLFGHDRFRSAGLC